MKLSSQFVAVAAFSLMAGLTCGPVLAQRFVLIGQTAAQQRRAERELRREQQQLRPRAPLAVGPRATGPNLNGMGPGGSKLPPRVIERLQDMPLDKQEQFLQNNRRFQNLPPQQQAQLRQRLEAWNRLSPGQQEDLRERQQVWEQMTPEQQRDVRQNLLPRWQQLPRPRRQAILQRLHSLRDISEADRQAKLDDPAFVEGLNAEDRETLGQLAHLHVGMAPDPPAAQ